MNYASYYLFTVVIEVKTQNYLANGPFYLIFAYMQGSAPKKDGANLYANLIDKNG
jgi:hypothetical protein